MPDAPPRASRKKKWRELVIGGGGMNGIMMLGAAQCLYDRGLPPFSFPMTLPPPDTPTAAATAAEGVIANAAGGGMGMLLGAAIAGLFMLFGLYMLRRYYRRKKVRD